MLDDYMPDEDIKIALRVLHPWTKQDTCCPYVEWLAEDLAHCPGAGDWHCKLQERKFLGEYGGPTEIGYDSCNHSEHSTCPIYLNTNKNKAE